MQFIHQERASCTTQSTRMNNIKFYFIIEMILEFVDYYYYYFDVISLLFIVIPQRSTHTHMRCPTIVLISICRRWKCASVLHVRRRIDSMHLCWHRIVLFIFSLVRKVCGDSCSLPSVHMIISSRSRQFIIGNSYSKFSFLLSSLFSSHFRVCTMEPMPRSK